MLKKYDEYKLKTMSCPTKEELNRIDYKNLLKKYIGHVDWEEGITFIDMIDEYKEIKFTPLEVKELKRIESELE